MNKNNPTVSYGFSYVIPENAPQYLVGRILTIVEALGLKETQEKSLKDLIREEIYKIQRNDEGTLWLTPELNNEIHRVYQEIEAEKRSENVGSNYPVSSGIYDYKFKITYEKVENPYGDMIGTSTGTGVGGMTITAAA